MELTYQVLGADGKQYGPVTAEQLHAWIREGRVPSRQQVKRSDMDYWAAADAFEELQEMFAPPATASNTTAGGAAPALPRRATSGIPRSVKSNACWFYWIAALSLVNSFAALSGSAWHFILGLGVTQFIDGFGLALGSSGKAVALGLDLLVAAIFVVLGIFGCKAHTWSFIAGIVLFSLDAIVFIIAGDWVGVAFHAFVLYCLIRGLQACRGLEKQ